MIFNVGRFDFLNLWIVLEARMVHLRPEMCARARDLWGRKNGRLSIEADRIVFKEDIPMALKNRIKPGNIDIFILLENLTSWVKCIGQYQITKGLGLHVWWLIHTHYSSQHFLQLPASTKEIKNIPSLCGNANVHCGIRTSENRALSLFDVHRLENWCFKKKYVKLSFQKSKNLVRCILAWFAAILYHCCNFQLKKLTYLGIP